MPAPLVLPAPSPPAPSTTQGSTFIMSSTTDTADDHLGFAVPSYAIMNLTDGRIEETPLRLATHDATYIRTTNSIFYLEASRRKLTRPCPPLLSNATYLLENITEIHRNGSVIWTMAVEEVICHKAIVTPDRLAAKSNMEPFHCNSLWYFPSENAVLFTALYQSTAYKFHRRSKKLLWAIGEHGTIPLYPSRSGVLPIPWVDIHFCTPLGYGRYGVFNNNDLNWPQQNSYPNKISVVFIDEANRVAFSVVDITGPNNAHRTGGGAVFNAPANLIGGEFGNPPYQELIVKSLHQPSTRPLVACTFNGSFIYGARIIVRSFGLHFASGYLSLHAPFWDMEPMLANITIYNATGCTSHVLELLPYMQYTALRMVHKPPMRVLVCSSTGFQTEWKINRHSREYMDLGQGVHKG